MGGEEVSEGRAVVGCKRARGGRRCWDPTYQITGLPLAGDDLSKKALISAHALGSDKSLLLSVTDSNTCSFRLKSGRDTPAGKHRLAPTAVRPRLLI